MNDRRARRGVPRSSSSSGTVSRASSAVAGSACSSSCSRTSLRLGSSWARAPVARAHPATAHTTRTAHAGGSPGRRRSISNASVLTAEPPAWGHIGTARQHPVVLADAGREGGSTDPAETRGCALRVCSGPWHSAARFGPGEARSGLRPGQPPGARSSIEPHSQPGCRSRPSWALRYSMTSHRW